MLGGDPCRTEIRRVTWSPALWSEFRTRHVTAMEPVVLDGLLRDWAALTRWTWRWLRARLAARTVSVSVDPEGICSNREYVAMRFGEFLDRIDDRTLYLTEVHLPTTLPELMGDLIVPAIIPPGSGMPGRQPNAWLSGRGVGKGFHYDNADNVICQVVGQKRIWLVSPDQSNGMYPDDESATHPHNSRVRSPLRVDLAQFPAFADVELQVVDLGAGEALYVPPRWWHSTMSLARSISVNYWWIE